MQIMLVEDNTADIFLVRHALEQHGVQHELTVVGDGDEALNLLRAMRKSDEKCPELILLDLNLPRQDGMTVLRGFRETESCLDSEVIVLTSSDASWDRKGAADLGARYFRKPFDLDDFMKLGELIKTILTERGETASH